ncbi:hypothetical protein GVX81_10660 [[Haemophilus] felis]|uniref:HipA-like C-terminal domain-containing protein n=1 Tax=[Haemophilus] felis TaxID=123822 RepID=A0A1T0AV39_9PAST|nr:hypothetical protein [[Haemophilus] felis]NBI41779.1 hypothetical protein [[Haemophilus] felis]OOS00715.1 hypothetical protein B0188_10520 [[Haemophilus] felis]
MTRIINQKDLLHMDSLHFANPIQQDDIYQAIYLPIIDLLKSAENTAQVSNFALALDGGEYALKGQNDSKMDLFSLETIVCQKIIQENAPISELFCYKIIELLQLPIPQCRILIDERGELYFGSVIDKGKPGVLSFSKFLELVITPSKYSYLFHQQLWVIYALDCFFFNIDRHFGNYICIENSFGYTQLKPIDFGLSSFTFHLFPYKPMYLANVQLCNTQKSWKQLNNLLLQDAQYIANLEQYKELARHTLDKLKLIELSKIRNIVDGIPDKWLSKKQKNDLLNWWNSEQLSERILRIQSEELK